MASRLIHPRMMRMLERDFFPQICTIEESTETQSTTGQPKQAWAAIPALTALECRVGEVSGGERRSSNQIYLDATNIILLAGDYPGITEKQRAVVDGQVYDILLARRSAEEAVTRLVARVVR